SRSRPRSRTSAVRSTVAAAATRLLRPTGPTACITGTNTFTFNGTGTSFSNIQNLTGGSGNDTFTVASGVTSFNGAIDGGSGGTDTLATTSGTNAWTISGTNAGTLNGTGTTFTNIDVLAGGGGTDTLTSTIAGTVAWSIT